MFYFLSVISSSLDLFASGICSKLLISHLAPYLTHHRTLCNRSFIVLTVYWFHFVRAYPKSSKKTAFSLPNASCKSILIMPKTLVMIPNDKTILQFHYHHQFSSSSDFSSSCRQYYSIAISVYSLHAFV